jgi:phenylpropionate dioxygenase-like ring-hydroxylating dioxygenase large terminal subunit
MRRETELELIRRFFKHQRDRTTELAEEPYRNPASVYTDPKRLAREWEALFWGKPLLTAISGEIAEPGEYTTTEVAGVPLLLVRGEDGQVRCHLNICRHRGSRVATGRGVAGRVFSCPYHSWTYDVEGNLLGQPLSRTGFEGLDQGELGLIPVPVAERFGLIFTRPGGTAPIDVEEHLAGMGEELAGFRLESYRFFAERSGIWEMNWKQAVDTFTESYHVFALHKRTIAQAFLSVPAVQLMFGPHSLAPAMRRSITELAEQDESAWDLRKHASMVIRVFPNTILNLPMDGHAELWEVYPERGMPNRTRISMKFYTPEEPASDKARQFWQTNFDLTCSVVFAEDFDAQAEIYAGLRTGLQPELIYGRNEPNLIQFHTAIGRVLG